MGLTLILRGICAAILAAWVTVSAALAAPPEPAWPAGAPESAGFDSATLAAAIEAIHAKVPNTHEVVLIRHGRLILDAVFYPYDGASPHNLASVTKSVMTTLIAIAAEQGKLGLDQPMLSFFPGRAIANRDARKQRVTVRHLAGMSSGLDCVGEHDEPTLHQMNASPDWIQFALDLKMVAEPGTTFSYCSPGMHLLSAILQQATGMTALEFARHNLFDPLAIGEAIWPSDPQGVTHGWGDLYLYPLDAAKIGYLWLHGGEWDGKRIVSEDWVASSSRLQMKTNPYWGDDYGYGWWIMSGESIPQFAASGRGGQRIAVFPSLDTVAVTVGAGIEPGDVLGRLAEALKSTDTALPANPAGEARLRAALAAVRQQPAPDAVPALPATALSISGKTYRFPPNPLQLETMRIAFDGSAEAQLALTFRGGQAPRNGAVGLDGVYRMSPGENGLPLGIRGRWIDAERFVTEYDGIANIDAFLLTIRFTGSRAIIEAKERTYEAGVTIEGKTDD
jgi:CubicO group peptidase (beta-lactamase class C family)